MLPDKPIPPATTKAPTELPVDSVVFVIVTTPLAEIPFVLKYYYYFS
jgi:hypothetical protein